MDYSYLSNLIVKALPILQGLKKWNLCHITFLIVTVHVSSLLITHNPAIPVDCEFFKNSVSCNVDRILESLNTVPWLKLEFK